MIVLVIGPSGVGKSETCRSAALHFTNVVFRDLDGLAAKLGQEEGLVDPAIPSELYARIGAGKYLDIGQRAIKTLADENPGKHLVIDVGAGFQMAPSAAQLHHFYSIIALTAFPTVAHQRIVTHRSDSRSLDQFKRVEFSRHRVAVYDSAGFKIDTSDASPEQTKAEFIQLLSSLLDSEPPAASNDS